MVEDSPDEYVHVLTGRNFWGDNPLGRSILGSPENIASFDSETIKAFFHRLYQPDRIIISVAGNIDHTHFIELIGPAFESIQAGNGFPERITPEARTLVDVNYRKLEQVHICLGTKGLRIGDPRRYSFSLLNTILGGNMSSRLFQEIREKRGLAYAVYSFISSHVDTGMFGVYLGVDPKRTGETTELILDEIHRLTAEKVDSSELRGAKEYTKGSLMLASESTDNQMVRTAQNEIHFGREIGLEEVLEEIEKVTRDQIINLANELFQKNQMVLTILGPLNKKKVFEKLLYH
jgi:predicted Zn-dependent peptidase